MKRSLAPWLLLALAFSGSLATAQDFTGNYSLDGRYSNRRGTAAELTVTKTASGLQVERTGRYTGRRFRSVAPFTWTATEATQRGRVLRVTYTLDAKGQNLGLVNKVDPDADPGAATVSEVRKTSMLLAIYRLAPDGRSLSELIVNVTRRSSENWWFWIRTQGSKTSPVISGWKDGFRERGITDPSLYYHFNVSPSSLPQIKDRDVIARLQQDPTNVTLGRIALVRTLIWENTMRYRLASGQDEGLITDGGDWRVGQVTDATDGQVYDVVHWRDIDDNSFSVYWKNGALYSIYYEN